MPAETSIARAVASPVLVRLRIGLTYTWRHGRLPDLIRPSRFTELVQRRKLFDRDPRLPILSDKLVVKDFVASAIGREWVIPTLWHGTDLPKVPPWAPGFVVKARHGCNQLAFVRTASDDWGRVRRRAKRWMAKPYGRWLDEWLYSAIPRGLVVEPFVGLNGELPVDYKLFVFDGQVAFVQVHLDREHRHRWIMFDRDWHRVSSTSCDRIPPAPRSLPAMIKAAETLARGFDFVRVDLYEIAGKPMFGEMTFYPGSGLDPFDPPELDPLLGGIWLAAIASNRDEELQALAA